MRTAAAVLHTSERSLKLRTCYAFVILGYGFAVGIAPVDMIFFFVYMWGFAFDTWCTANLKKRISVASW